MPAAGPDHELADLVALAPKAELHVHVEGTLEPELAFEIGRRNGVPLTVCPLSNVKLRVVDGLARHNLPALLAAGLRASVHSDDPAYFGGYVNDALRGCLAALPLTRRDAQALLRTSLESSFLEPAEKARHVERLDELFAS